MQEPIPGAQTRWRGCVFVSASLAAPEVRATDQAGLFRDLDLRLSPAFGHDYLMLTAAAMALAMSAASYAYSSPFSRLATDGSPM